MREVIYENEPHEDTARPITDEDRLDPDFVWAEKSVEAVFKELGASVIGGISYAGEPQPAKLFIPPARTNTMTKFNNRPA